MDFSWQHDYIERIVLTKQRMYIILQLYNGNRHGTRTKQREMENRFGITTK